MTYSYYEHVSDIGIRAEGGTLEEAFTSGVEACLGVMFDLETIEPVEGVEVVAEAPEVDLLFVEVLNEVLSLLGRDELALRTIEGARLERTDEGWTFTGTARGEKYDPHRHPVETEVKGATYSGLAYRKVDGAHVLTCVLDV